MNLVGYLVTLANLQGFDHSGRGGGGAIEDLSIKVGEIQTILNELGQYSQFSLENFKETGYYRNGNIGIYLSKNLRDYVYNGIGSATDEAILLTLIFNDAKNGGIPSIVKDPTLSFFLHKDHEVDDDVRKGIDQYVKSLSNRREKRTVSESKQ